jgi:DNA-binding LytR/AlgR family response regulator
MIFRIAICDKEAAQRALCQRLCQDFFLRRNEHCVVEQFTDAQALLQKDAAGARYELYLIGLDSSTIPEGLSVAGQLRERGRREPMAFLARNCAHAYRAYRVDAMQYLLCPAREDEMFALLERAVQPEYGPALPVPTAEGLRVLPYARIEYVECTHHIVHFHLTDGQEVQSLSQRVPFTQLAAPLLADRRFVRTHRSYLVNLAEVQLFAPGEFQMRSGTRIPVPREREKAARTVLQEWLEHIAPAGSPLADDKPSKKARLAAGDAGESEGGNGNGAVTPAPDPEQANRE